MKAKNDVVKEALRLLSKYECNKEEIAEILIVVFKEGKDVGYREGFIEQFKD